MFNKDNNIFINIIAKTVISIFVIVILCKCSSIQNGVEPKYIRNFNNNTDSFVVWSISDIQPRVHSEYIYFENAVKDVNENIPGVDLAFVAGDILHYTDKTKVLHWYNKTKGKSYIKNWYEIAGNHDAKNLHAFQSILKTPLHYSVEKGNVLFLFMSDIKKSAGQEIPRDVFLWWKDKVINNQDKIIITVTHAYLKQSGLFLSTMDSRNIDISDKFAEVLKNYKVDVWIAGHTHASNLLWRKVNVVKELNNTLFINTAIMRKDLGREVSSRILVFNENSDELFVRLRLHEYKVFDSRKEFIYKLSKKFKNSKEAPVKKPWK